MWLAAPVCGNGFAALAALLYERDNVRGPHEELWWHRHGCRAWFRVVRDTRDNAVLP